MGRWMNRQMNQFGFILLGLGCNWLSFIYRTKRNWMLITTAALPLLNRYLLWSILTEGCPLHPGHEDWRKESTQHPTPSVRYISPDNNKTNRETSLHKLRVIELTFVILTVVIIAIVITCLPICFLKYLFSYHNSLY